MIWLALGAGGLAAAALYAFLPGENRVKPGSILPQAVLVCLVVGGIIFFLGLAH